MSNPISHTAAWVAAVFGFPGAAYKLAQKAGLPPDECKKIAAEALEYRAVCNWSDGNDELSKKHMQEAERVRAMTKGSSPEREI